MIFKRRQILPYFLGSLLAFIFMAAGFCYSYRTQGNVPFSLGIAYILVMALCLIFMVLGLLELTYWREERRRLGLAGVALYTVVFLCMLAFYVIGVFFG